jgi:hypothetical protein
VVKCHMAAMAQKQRLEPLNPNPVPASPTFSRCGVGAAARVLRKESTAYSPSKDVRLRGAAALAPPL